MKDAFLALAAVCGLASAAASPAVAQNLADAKIVFVGTVQTLNAATFAEVPTSPRTAIVRVDTVITKPKEFSLLRAGQNVTVELREGAEAQAGARARFYVVSWIAGGDGQLALREIGREPAPPQELAPAGAEAARAVSDRQLLDRANKAAVIVVGRVTAIRSPAVPEAAVAGGSTRITEHDPQWKEASIRVTSAIKGATANTTVTVRFPASNDVAWKDAPKFRVGQTGTFLFDQAGPQGAFELGGVLTAASKDQVLAATAGARMRQLLATPR